MGWDFDENIPEHLTESKHKCEFQLCKMFIYFGYSGHATHTTDII